LVNFFDVISRLYFSGLLFLIFVSLLNHKEFILCNAFTQTRNNLVVLLALHWHWVKNGAGLKVQIKKF